MEIVRADYAAGRVTERDAVAELMQIFPGIDMADAAGWHRLLTED